MRGKILGLGIAIAAVTSFAVGRLTARSDGNSVPYVSRNQHSPGPQEETVLPRPQQASKVRSEAVQLLRRGQTIRSFGIVKADENRVFRLMAGSPGRVTNLGRNSFGMIVHKDEVLATFFSNELVKLEQAYFFSLEALQRDKSNGLKPDDLKTEESVRNQEAVLISMGMGEAQLHEIRQTRKATREIEICSPVDGIVLSRSIYPAQVLEDDQEMYRIAGLDSVFVFAALTPAEMTAILPGTKARVLEPKTGRVFEAKISSSVPLANNPGPLLQLKLEVANKDLPLRPDMPVQVEFKIPDTSQITVPATAILDTGFARVVFVETADGTYHKTVIQTGNRLGDRVIVHQGLKEQDKVVISANFLIDSESRLRQAGSAFQQ